jgi:hypothetical protein
LGKHSLRRALQFNSDITLNFWRLILKMGFVSIAATGMNEQTPRPQPPSIPTNVPQGGVRNDKARGHLQKIDGAADMTVDQVQQAVAEGGRFVIYQFCVSVLVLSFKRSSGIKFIPAGRSRVASGAPYSVISFFAGWWGIPWGPIWTVSTMITNMNGGKDVTNHVLSALGLPQGHFAPAKRK